MHLARTLSQLADASRGGVVAIGNFDGMHLGHMAVIRAACDKANELGCMAAVLSFYPHPRQYFAPHIPSLALQRLHEKVEELEQAGIGQFYLVRFNHAFADISAEAFAREVLHGLLGARHVVTGDDFHYGKGRGGDTLRLAHDLGKLGIGYSQASAVQADGLRVSSSHIRRLLAEGHLPEAEAMLGRAFTIAGHIAHGDKRGRLIGFPTANLSLSQYVVPHHGVYVVSGRLRGEKNWMHGVANIGMRPTFLGQSAPRLEAHFFHHGGDWYGKRLQVRLHAFLRPEMRFDGMEALKAQIEQDVLAAKDYWSSRR
jgi:riboflavin kinase/FMN adenylyltransferase